MAIDLTQTKEQTKQMQAFMKPQHQNKVVDKQKIADKTPRTLPIRGQ